MIKRQHVTREEEDKQFFHLAFPPSSEERIHIKPAGEKTVEVSAKWAKRVIGVIRGMQEASKAGVKYRPEEIGILTNELLKDAPDVR